MILTDVYVPSVSKHYTFQLEEKLKVGILIAELAELICQKEQCQFIGDKEELLLCVYQDNAILDREKTLEEYGIVDGGRLILV